jgi:Zn-dependent membrane protease YugP
MFFFDPLYLLFSLPALALGLWAQFRVMATFKKFAQVPTPYYMTGAEIARRILGINGLAHVKVEMAQGFLSDHYDPAARVLRLSPDVYNGDSMSAAGVAAHEAGHAIQHAQGYVPLHVRSAIVPVVSIGSWVGPLLFMVGLLMVPVLGTGLAWAGVLLFAGVAVFTIVTLPVEFDASSRAKEILLAQGIIRPQEMRGVSAVLDAAALTYVAGAVQAISTLLYYVFLLTGFSRSEE